MASVWAAHRAKILAVGCAVGAVLVFEAGGYPAFPRFKTTGVKSIEDRFSSGGGSKDHVPGAATPLGNHENVTGNTLVQKGPGLHDQEGNRQDQGATHQVVSREREAPEKNKIKNKQG